VRDVDPLEDDVERGEQAVGDRIEVLGVDRRQLEQLDAAETAFGGGVIGAAIDHDVKALPGETVGQLGHVMLDAAERGGDPLRADHGDGGEVEGESGIDLLVELEHEIFLGSILGGERFRKEDVTDHELELARDHAHLHPRSAARRDDGEDLPEVIRGHGEENLADALRPQMRLERVGVRENLRPLLRGPLALLGNDDVAHRPDAEPPIELEPLPEIGEFLPLSDQQDRTEQPSLREEDELDCSVEESAGRYIEEGEHPEGDERRPGEVEYLPVSREPFGEKDDHHRYEEGDQDDLSDPREYVRRLETSGKRVFLVVREENQVYAGGGEDKDEIGVPETLRPDRQIVLVEPEVERAQEGGEQGDQIEKDQSDGQDDSLCREAHDRSIPLPL
jgi:hypothetical protein